METKNEKTETKVSTDAKIKEMHENTIGLDDSFNFKCIMCGKCCRNREDVLLTGPDVFRAAKELGMTIESFIHTYCEIYIGSTSRIPVCRIKPEGNDKHCPLLSENKCRIHSAKPSVCALFPLARVWDENGEARYHVQSNLSHRSNKTYTVRKWLERNNLPTDDVPGRIWVETVTACVKFVLNNEDNLSEKEKTHVWNLMTFMMYYSYVDGIDLEKQMRAMKDSLTDSLPRYVAMFEAERQKKDEKPNPIDAASQTGDRHE